MGRGRRGGWRGRGGRRPRGGWEGGEGGMEEGWAGVEGVRGVERIGSSRAFRSFILRECGIELIAVIDRRRKERDNSAVTIWPPSPRAPERFVLSLPSSSATLIQLTTAPSHPRARSPLQKSTGHPSLAADATPPLPPTPRPIRRTTVGAPRSTSTGTPSFRSPSRRGGTSGSGVGAWSSASSCGRRMRGTRMRMRTCGSRNRVRSLLMRATKKWGLSHCSCQGRRVVVTGAFSRVPALAVC